MGRWPGPDERGGGRWVSGRGRGVQGRWGQVLLAEPEERRSFMDMRLLLARGDIGEAESLTSPAAAAATAPIAAGLSADGVSWHEPGGRGRVGGWRGRKEQ